MLARIFTSFIFLALAAQPAYAGGSQPGTSVSVTAADPSVVITPSPGTGTFTIGTTELLNAQGTAASYTVLSSDMGKTITHNKATAVAVTVPQAGTTGFEAGKSFGIVNIGAGTVTYTPTTSTVNGNASLALAQGQGSTWVSDGTNWVAKNGLGSASGSASLSAFNTFTAGNAVTPSTVSISTSTFTPNFALSNNFGVTLVHASCPCTLANPSNPVAGESGIIAVTQSATGSDLISSYGSSYVFTNTVAPTLSTAANAVDYLSYYVLDSTHVRVAPLISSVVVGSGAELAVSFQPGQLTSVNNTKGGFAKFVKASTVDNIEVSATSFTCTGNPTVTLYECGTSTTCASPTTIGSATVTAAGTLVDGSISAAAIAAGDYVGWAVSAGTCTALNIAGTAQAHAN